MNPSRMLRMFTRASEHNMRKISDAALISRLNTPTGRLQFQRHVLGNVHGQRGLVNTNIIGDKIVSFRNGQIIDLFPSHRLDGNDFIPVNITFCQVPQRRVLE